MKVALIDYGAGNLHSCGKALERALAANGQTGTVEVGAANDQGLATAIEGGKVKASDVRVIWESKPIPNGPTAIRKDLPETLRKAVKAAFLSFNDPKGLDAFNIKGYIAADDKDFDPIRDAREVKKSLSK